MKDDELAKKSVRDLMLYAWEYTAKNDGNYIFNPPKIGGIYL